MNKYDGRLGIVQRVLPRYRASFFDLLAKQTQGGLSVFAGQSRPSEAIPSAAKLSSGKWQHANNVHFLSGPLYFCYQRGLLSWLEKWDPDALIVEANPRYLSTPAAVRWMRERGRPIIGWGLGAPAARGPLASFRIGQRKKFLRQFDAVIAYSSRGAAEYRALGIPAKRIFIAPNAVTMRPKRKLPKRTVRFSTGRATLLYVGRLQKRKRLDSLLRACASLPEKLRPRLWIVGDGPARSELKALAADIYPGTEFTGTLFGSQLDSKFQKADLFVLPGTGGLAIQQAMAFGLPVVVAEGDGSQEGMVTSANGWLVSPDDEASLARTLKSALANPERLRKMGVASFKLVQEKFNLENMAAAFVDALNAVSK